MSAIEERIKSAVEQSPIRFDNTKRDVLSILQGILDRKPRTITGLSRRPELARRGQLLIIDQTELTGDEINTVAHLTTITDYEISLSYYRNIEAYLLLIGGPASQVFHNDQVNTLEVLQLGLSASLHTHTRAGHPTPSPTDLQTSRDNPLVRFFLGVNPGYYRVTNNTDWLFNEFTGGRSRSNLWDAESIATELNQITNFK